MISQLVSVWIKVLTHPSVATFDEEKPNWSNQRTLTSVLIAAIIGAILSFLSVLVLSSIMGGVARSFGAPAYVTPGPVAAFRALVQSFVQTLVGFYLFNFALQFVAGKLFGGRGTFEQQAYLTSLAYVPIAILAAVIGLVPCLGWLVALLLFIYGLVLLTFAVQSGQGLAVGSAIISWIIAAVITGIVLMIIGLISGGWLSSGLWS